MHCLTEETNQSAPNNNGVQRYLSVKHTLLTNSSQNRGRVADGGRVADEISQSPLLKVLLAMVAGLAISTLVLAVAARFQPKSQLKRRYGSPRLHCCLSPQRNAASCPLPQSRPLEYDHVGGVASESRAPSHTNNQRYSTRTPFCGGSEGRINWKLRRPLSLCSGFQLSVSEWC